MLFIRLAEKMLSVGDRSPISTVRGAAAADAWDGRDAIPVLTFEEIRKRWWWVLERVRLRSPTTEALLRLGRVEGLDVHDVIVTWPWQFHVQCLDEPRRRELIEDVIEQVFGRRYGLRCVRVEP